MFYILTIDTKLDIPSHLWSPSMIVSTPGLFPTTLTITVIICCDHGNTCDNFSLCWTSVKVSWNLSQICDYFSWFRSSVITFNDHVRTSWLFPTISCDHSNSVITSCIAIAAKAVIISRDYGKTCDIVFRLEHHPVFVSSLIISHDNIVNNTLQMWQHLWWFHVISTNIHDRLYR